MAATRRDPEAREVTVVEALVTMPDPALVEAFLSRCTVGSLWRARIRTAEVEAVVAARAPLGLIDERQCLCVRFRLDRAVPVEPGLRFLVDSVEQEPPLTAAGLVRPWRL